MTTNNKDSGSEMQGIPEGFKQWIEQTRPKDVDRDYTPAEAGYQHGYVAGAKAAYRHLSTPPSSASSQKVLQWVNGKTMPPERDIYICEIGKRKDGIHSIVVRYLTYTKGFDCFHGLEDDEYVVRWLCEPPELPSISPETKS